MAWSHRGTYDCECVEPSDVVDPQYVLSGQQNYAGGEEGTLVLPAPAVVDDGVEYGVGGDGSVGEDVDDCAEHVATATELIRVS